MSESYNLMEVYENMLRKNVTVISEEIEKRNRTIRFVMPAILDFSVSQDDIEECYTFADFTVDVEGGVKEKEIISKVSNIIEIIAQEKINGLNKMSDGFEIKSTKRPELKNAQFYRLTVKDVLDSYSEQYDKVQISLVNTEETHEQPIN